MYTVYKTTNKINSKIYVGVHKTDNPHDSYLGSGKLLKQAILKEGVEHFSKEILSIFDTASEAYKLEREIVNDDFVARDDTYNLIIGGIPTSDWVESRKDHYSRNIKTFLGRSHSEATKQKISEKSKLYRHSEESKRKISEANKGKVCHNKGKPQTAESNLKRSQSHLTLEKIPCPHCGKTISPQNAKRWHFANCKLAK